MAREARAASLYCFALVLPGPTLDAFVRELSACDEYELFSHDQFEKGMPNVRRAFARILMHVVVEVLSGPWSAVPRSTLNAVLHDRGPGLACEARGQDRADVAHGEVQHDAQQVRVLQHLARRAVSVAIHSRNTDTPVTRV